MNQKLESIVKKGKMLALAGVAALAIGCASTPEATQHESPASSEIVQGMATKPTLQGKSLGDLFKEFDAMDSSQQVALAKSLNDMSAWDLVLLARYVPVDGIMDKLSSFYSTDYKWYLQSLLSESGLDPTIASRGGDVGLGQLSPSSEKWARELYNTGGYKFKGQEITDNASDPYTNLVLSSIIFRKASEERVSDLDALYSLYTKGLSGVSLNKEGYYELNNAGKANVDRAKSFSDIANKMIIFSWISRDDFNMSIYVDDDNLRRIIRANNGAYDGEAAYRGMTGFLNSESNNREKYSDETGKMLRDESTNFARWVSKLYGN